MAADSPRTSPRGKITSPIKSESKPQAGPPLDFSFKDLHTVNDVLYEEPGAGTPANPALTRGINENEYLDSLSDPSQPKSPTGKQFVSNANAVRVCNNYLHSLKGIDKVMGHLLDAPKELTWLDASCNELTSIDDAILNFPKLKVLYLHGNQISKFSDCVKLAELKDLRKLTLHGCPVAEKQGYKMHICAHLPQLQSLDFSTITKVDRDKIQQWNAANERRLARDA